ncbi:MAG TPA: hypothetical protein V6D17_02035 [Candidatus Obscuribacterales bacterium]
MLVRPGKNSGFIGRARQHVRGASPVPPWRLIAVAMLAISMHMWICPPPSHGKTTEASAASSPGYEINAASSYAGALSCHVSHQGVKVASDKLKMTWILRAPAWNAQLYNANTQRYIDIPYQEWKKRGSFGLVADRRATLKLVKTNETAQMQGLNVRQYLVFAIPRFPAAAMKAGGSDMKVAGGDMKVAGGDMKAAAGDMKAAAGDIRATAISGAPEARRTTGAAKAANPPAANPREAEMWITKDVAVPVQFNELMSKIFVLPQEQGLPMKISCRQRNGKLTPIWHTLDLKRRAIPASTFLPLAGYTKVKDEVAMMLGEDELMFGDSPMSTEPNQKKSTSSQKQRGDL